MNLCDDYISIECNKVNFLQVKYNMRQYNDGLKKHIISIPRHYEKCLRTILRTFYMRYATYCILYTRSLLYSAFCITTIVNRLCILVIVNI